MGRWVRLVRHGEAPACCRRPGLQRGAPARRNSADDVGLLASAPSVEEATAKYQEAQEILLKDLPSIPLWHSNVTGVSAETVDNVVFGWDSVPLYHAITKE